jgi:hypothetical protein
LEERYFETDLEHDSPFDTPIYDSRSRSMEQGGKMKRNRIIVVFLAILFISYGPAFGETLEFTPHKDANVKSGLPNANFNNAEFNTGDENAGGNNYGYIHFDLQTAPSQVKKATLILYNRKERCTYSSGSVDLYVVLGPWQEETITYYSQPTVGFTGQSVRINQMYQDYIEFDVTSLYHRWQMPSEENFGLMLTTHGSADYRYCSAGYSYFGCFPGTFYSAESEFPDKWPRLVLEIDNHPPEVDAGENVDLKSHEVQSSIILGTASDVDGNALSYRWLEKDSVLSDWQDVAEDGTAALDLSALPVFALGEHVLTLEVSDGQAAAQDTMTLTVENSAPTVVASGDGVYEIFTPVVVGGEVADFDGDPLTYEWRYGEQILDSGALGSLTLSSSTRGYGVSLPDCVVADLDFGIHTLTLSVSDGVNAPVTDTVTVEITDTTQPTLAPTADRTILWPPNHRFKKVVIRANADDNSGAPPRLSATVSSNEPDSGLWRRDRSPDWREPVIDQQNGIITVRLRAERAGRGDGRTYTIRIAATDQSGNSSVVPVEVVVPHNRGMNFDRLRQEMQERLQRQRERIEARRDRIQERREQRVETRRNKMQERRERIEARRDRIKERLERFKSRMRQRHGQRR